MMRSIGTGLLVAAVLVAMMWIDPPGAQGQQNWIKCRHNLTGEEQMFPGMQCPHNWHPV